MARSRNIKPSFFTSEQLADQDPLGRILFIGMWTLADYKGDFEWKERTIKVQLLPFDNCDVKALAINLDKSRLVSFYSDGDRVFVHIPNFRKHQNPHPNEKKKGSDIPAYSETLRQVVDLQTLAINRDKSRQESEQKLSDPADSLLLNPDSPSLIPSSGATSGAGAGKPPKTKKSTALDFDSWPDQPSDQILSDWIAMRKRLKADVSQTVVNQFGKELRLAVEQGYSVDHCLAECVTSNWRGFKAAWIKNREADGRSRHNEFENRDYTAGVASDGTF